MNADQPRQSAPIPAYPRRERWVLAGLLLLCVLLRCGVLLRYSNDLNDDRDAYLSIARSLAAGQGFATEGAAQPTAFRPPLYPLLISPMASTSMAWLRGVFNVLCGVGTAWLVWDVGRRLALSLAARSMSLLLISCDPLLLRYTAFPMTESLCTLLTALWIWRLSQCSTSKAGSLLTGVVFGLAVLCRPTMWAVGGLYALMWICHAWLSGKLTRANLSRSGFAYVLIGVGAVVTPWVLRNWGQFGRPILMTTHGGYTILLGNNEAFYREVVEQPWGTVWDGSHGPGQQAWVTQLNREMDAAGLESELARDRYQSQLARDTIQQHPQLFLRACLLRIARFWGVRPIGPAAEGLPPVILWGIALFYSSLWVLLILGFWRLMIRWPSIHQWLPMFTLIVALTCVHAIYWSNARMRAPAMPAIALIAGFSISKRRKIGITGTT